MEDMSLQELVVLQRDIEEAVTKISERKVSVNIKSSRRKSTNLKYCKDLARTQMCIP